MGGEASAELRLVVVTSLHVEVSPSVLSVHIGGTAEFKCNVHSEVNKSKNFITNSLSLSHSSFFVKIFQNGVVRKGCLNEKHLIIKNVLF